MKTALTKGELVNHPVRLRIIDAVTSAALTPKQLTEKLSDIPQATLYRQINILEENGILEVVSQRQTRGAIESTYGLAKGSTRFTREEFASMSPDDHKSCHALLVGQASSNLERYLAQPDYDTTEDGMTYFAAKLHLTNEDARQLRLDILDLMKKYASPHGEGGRFRRITISSFPEPNL